MDAARESNSADTLKRREAEILKNISPRERMVLALYLGHRWNHFSEVFKIDGQRSEV
jgi:hypothetical protein